MRKLKINVFILLLSIPLFLLNGCSTDTKLFEKPIGDYLSENYGIKNGDFKILSADSALGISDHNTYVEIKKPYHTVAYFIVNSESHYEVVKNESDDVFLEIFKGAYVEQHRDVLKQSDKMIKKYNLLSESPTEYHKGKHNFYYYLHINIDEQQEKELVENFKRDQKINTDNIMKMLKDSTPRDHANYTGVINFRYYYNTYKNSETIPNAQDIMDDFEKSHVLTEGIYNIAVKTIYSSPKETEETMDDRRNNNVMFTVDKQGKFEILKTTVDSR
ncbi:hypothetical protein SAMN04487767_10112 [Bacillus wiedmannii]|uniref:Lipoprotein n=1 Tax=Bacillus wiedmannii TaxID=1890302 RepID=A0A1G6I7P0_9BACI|nr:hypothetical protein [Bacillus wiedmannii]KMP28121.1 hypothetical protein TU50_13070 [Bacillus wiedmannii]PHD63722.1 hypothetical protein COF57_01215 [Bacillus wiedmannii]SDC02448.1 hypothetical protein SAMN04487767_10112 [Bacillus wiedmannii]HDX9613674.1 hypothetical protein [Bacillus toyonensis]